MTCSIAWPPPGKGARFPAAEPQRAAYRPAATSPMSRAQAMKAPTPVDSTLSPLVHDCHFAVLSGDDLRASGAGRRARVDGNARLGRAVGAPGFNVAAESFGEAGAVRAVPDGTHAEARLWCLEALGGEVGDGVALGQG